MFFELIKLSVFSTLFIFQLDIFSNNVKKMKPERNLNFQRTDTVWYLFYEQAKKQTTITDRNMQIFIHKQQNFITKNQSIESFFHLKSKYAILLYIILFLT